MKTLAQPEPRHFPPHHREAQRLGNSLAVQRVALDFALRTGVPAGKARSAVDGRVKQEISATRLLPLHSKYRRSRQERRPA